MSQKRVVTVVSHNPHVAGMGQQSFKRLIVIRKWQRPAELDVVFSTHVHNDPRLDSRRLNYRVEAQPVSYLSTPRPIIFVALKVAIKDDPPMGSISADFIPIDLLPEEKLFGLLERKAVDLLLSVGEAGQSVCLQSKA